MSKSCLFDAVLQLHTGERMLRLALVDNELGGMDRDDLEQTVTTLRQAICHLIEEIVIKPHNYVG